MHYQAQETIDKPLPGFRRVMQAVLQ
jgi:hypothetical protein